MPIVIQSVSLDQYLLWLSSQNSPLLLPFKGSKVVLPSALPFVSVSKSSFMHFPLILRRNYSTNSAAGGQNFNLHNNPHLNQVCAKIVNLLSALTPTVLEYALDFLIKSRKTLVKKCNFPNRTPAFSAPLPEGFSTLYSIKGQPGIYYISSKEGNASYVGTVQAWTFTNVVVIIYPSLPNKDLDIPNFTLTWGSMVGTLCKCRS